jgi:hypothetical protein
MTVIPEMSRVDYIGYFRLYYYHRINTAAGELYVHASIIHPVVSVSVVKFCIKYICVWNLLLNYTLRHIINFSKMW